MNVIQGMQSDFSGENEFAPDQSNKISVITRKSRCEIVWLIAALFISVTKDFHIEPKIISPANIYDNCAI